MEMKGDKIGVLGCRIVTENYLTMTTIYRLGT